MLNTHYLTYPWPRTIFGSFRTYFDLPGTIPVFSGTLPFFLELFQNLHSCTLNIPILPKRSPSVVKTLSVLPSVREHSGHGQDPLANDRQGALDDYDGPLHSRISHPWIIFEPLTWYGYSLCSMINLCPRYDHQHPMFVFYLVTDKVALLVPAKLYLNDQVIRCAALQR